MHNGQEKVRIESYEGEIEDGTYVFYTKGVHVGTPGKRYEEEFLSQEFDFPPYEKYVH